ncbi:hypothetical protein Y032_0005g2523 [Ancylostoma ceylanicum]|uniref:Uncharacterized protein n=1 Tax=Ancylostoma ceylanicum TaxID=53326 RepID=A0A016VT48_9BILA|nr:hypothetical protein Y032_0005g2523 [Ancylostoma ceylanicum]
MMALKSLKGSKLQKQGSQLIAVTLRDYVLALKGAPSRDKRRRSGTGLCVEGNMIANAFAEHCYESLNPSESHLCNYEVRGLSRSPKFNCQSCGIKETTHFSLNISAVMQNSAEETVT